MVHRNRLVDPSTISRVALMTVEGEKDDISGIGQTYAAQKLCTNLADAKREHHLQPGVGHYGVFNGSRFQGRNSAENPRFRQPKTSAAEGCWRGPSAALPKAEARAPSKACATVSAAEFGGRRQ